MDLSVAKQMVSRLRGAGLISVARLKGKRQCVAPIALMDKPPQRQILGVNGRTIVQPKNAVVGVRGGGRCQEGRSCDLLKFSQKGKAELWLRI
ncbi:hypothetical protein EYF80_018632 [Liparis tanakae]|uniref:Uncharacterized protein n=1 Tax=Liparis tanakae TaxID=230148 RepID=A0A4Z2I1K1_9TELE|nr:hypothetical protein EYF80_018632 [Liparis tanakae]